MSMVDRIALSPLNQNVSYTNANGNKSLKRISLKPLGKLKKPSSLSRSSSLVSEISRSASFKTSKSLDANNEDIDVYVSKLKFKLKLALYKLNHPRFKKSLKSNNYKIYDFEYLIKSPSSSSTKLISPNASLSTINNHKISKRLHPQGSLYKKSFQNSININLTEKSQTSSLNSFIMNKNANNSNLKLFTIKKGSAHSHNHDMLKIPLTLNDSKLALASTSNSLIASNNMNSQSHMNSFTTNLSNSQDPAGSASQSLPPINKILKTPLKLTTSAVKSPEDIDQTIDDHSFDDSKKVNSSPLKHFATPNSFSVAKSLLQLGSGIYN